MSTVIELAENNMDSDDSLSETNMILPPNTRRAPGRPKKKRMRSQQGLEGADVEEVRVAKRHIQHCGRCQH